MVIQYSILCQHEKKTWNDYISIVVLIQSIFLFAYLSLESWRSVASHERQFVFGSRGGGHVLSLRWHSAAGFPKATCPVIILPTRSEIDKALWILPGGPFAMLIHTLHCRHTHTCKHSQSHVEIYREAHTHTHIHTDSDACTFSSESAGLTWQRRRQQQQMQGLRSIHHMLSLSQCAKWFY